MNEIQFNLFVMDAVDVDFTNAAAAADCEFNADVADVSLWIVGFFFCIVKFCLFFFVQDFLFVSWDSRFLRKISGLCFFFVFVVVMEFR